MMKVKELIARLKKLDPEMDCLFYDEDQDRFLEYGSSGDFPSVYDLDADTRDFRAVTPHGTTKKFVCF